MGLVGGYFIEEIFVWLLCISKNKNEVINSLSNGKRFTSQQCISSFQKIPFEVHQKFFYSKKYYL